MQRGLTSRVVMKRCFPALRDRALLMPSLSVNNGPLLRMRWEIETPVIFGSFVLCKHRTSAVSTSQNFDVIIISRFLVVMYRRLHAEHEQVN